ncbi:MAG: DivIVA domain-containing protein [Clostridia bacterium]
MKAKVLKELQGTLEQKERDISALKDRVSELSGKIDGYQNRETAVLNALTEAQTTGKRIIQEAEKRRDELVMLAENEKMRILHEAEEITNNAKHGAESITADAKMEAKRMLAQAEASMEEYRANADKLKAEVAEAAASAQHQAERFREFLGGVKLTNSTDYNSEFADISGMPDHKNIKLPEDYNNPAELMKSIYSIQGRNIPIAATENVQTPPATKSAPADDDNAHVWTVDEIMNAQLGDEKDDELCTDIDLDALIDKIIKG